MSPNSGCVIEQPRKPENLAMLPTDKIQGLNAANFDANVLAALPDVEQVLDVTAGQESAWAKTYCIKVQHFGGEETRYFMKVSVGHHGREALMGEFTSTSAIHSITPDFCPEPIAWGTFESDIKAHFYVCKFYDFSEGLPDPEKFCKSLARIHKADSPNGKFGFECVTYNGNIPQLNEWCDSWEEFFANGLHHILKLREERSGTDEQLNALLPSLFNIVIPRLLRPLESNGRKVKPSLVHGDLWCGNASVTDEDTGESLIYDPASFWAHNEYELGNWRPKRNMFTQEYFEAYHSNISISEPIEDFDDRNALYALFNLHAATLFPDQKSFVQMAVEEIQRLAVKFETTKTEQFVNTEGVASNQGPVEVEETPETKASTTGADPCQWEGAQQTTPIAEFQSSVIGPFAVTSGA